MSSVNRAGSVSEISLRHSFRCKISMCSYEGPGWPGYRDLGNRVENFSIRTLQPGDRDDSVTDNIIRPTNTNSELCLNEWATYLGESLAKNTSLTTLNLTIDNCDELSLSEDWRKGLGGGLVGNTSLTTLNLTINSGSLNINEDWTRGLGDGLARNTSLTTLNLTIGSSNLHMSKDWTNGLGDGLARNTTLTAVNLI